MGDLPVKTSPEEAPFPLTDVDKWVLSLTDEDFHCHDWEDMKNIVAENNLSVLKRKPSDLQRYMTWTAETKADYGSMTNYLLTHRLPKTWGTPPFTPASTIPFDDPSDFRVLINDWPYGLTSDITHIVVWSRTIIETDPQTGDMTPRSRQIVANFVKKFFADKLGPRGGEKVLWFKNWVALQSVRSLEHIHLMVKEAGESVINEWTKELDCHRMQN
ncbi:Uu.00g003090.m01.CDS01 [Anthostomella pinea]|uniref:Uu.00g003090.m01.CDS01 n=1 Tax=Anthostomella pinea TaxID=933095 RepID=A0AAI8YG96_9PEZI|nr:Uu.00g003090.m01.CDS01 [Anthostomella pinea]